MSDDFFIRNAQRRYREIKADLMEIDAGLARAEADSNDFSAQELIQGRADANAQMRNLEVDYSNYVASQQPRQSVTNETEWTAKAPEKMDGNDVDKIFQKSKYYDKGQWADPEVAQRVNAGLAEVQRRRRQGS